MPCELILVLDAPSPRKILPLLDRLAGTVKWVKIGLEMFTACGPACVEEVAALGYSIFLDLKFHDIPNTVAGAVQSACRLPVEMLTLHTSGGREMMVRAVEAAKKGAQQTTPSFPTPTAAKRAAPLLLGVTVLTSMDAAALATTGVNGTPADQVARLGQLAVEAGLRGLVCSPLELPILRSRLPADVILVTPGIRPLGNRAVGQSGGLAGGTSGSRAMVDDQARVMTPGEAARAGANFIVVGRPIMEAADPVEAARLIQNELGTGTRE